MRKLPILIICFLFLLISGNGIAFAEETREFEKEENVRVDYKWTISFNLPIDQDSIKPENIYVYDSSGKRAFIPFIEFNEDQTKLFVYAPFGNYEPNQSYILTINKEIQAVTGEKLTLTVKKAFKTESEAAVVQKYDQLINDIQKENISFIEALKQTNYNKNFFERAYSNLTAPFIPADNSEQAEQIRNIVMFQFSYEHIVKKIPIDSYMKNSINNAMLQEIIEETINHKYFGGQPTEYEQRLSENMSGLLVARITNDFVGVGPATENLMNTIFEPLDELLEQPTNGRRISESAVSVNEFIYQAFGIVTFADPNLEKAVRAKIRKSHGDILRSDVTSVTSLFANDRKIKDVEGIQLLPNLKSLYIEDNEIVNIGPLLKMPNLTRLDIYGNKVPQAGIDQLKAQIPNVYACGFRLGCPYN